nr:endoribonuclease YBEY, chloroplastic-like isoform X1 [Tanacetum cinerariifolium]
MKGRVVHDKGVSKVGLTRPEVEAELEPEPDKAYRAGFNRVEKAYRVRNFAAMADLSLRLSVPWRGRAYWSKATRSQESVIQAHPDMLEILFADSSKGSGVRMLLERFGVAPNEVMAIGDGENDIELASLGIALSNG